MHPGREGGESKIQITSGNLGLGGGESKNQITSGDLGLGGGSRLGVCWRGGGFSRRQVGLWLTGPKERQVG